MFSLKKISSISPVGQFFSRVNESLEGECFFETTLPSGKIYVISPTEKTELTESNFKDAIKDTFHWIMIEKDKDYSNQDQIYLIDVQNKIIASLGELGMRFSDLF